MRPDSARRFLVVAARRSGSNMLCTILGAHPDVLCHHELFNPGGVYVALERRDGPAPFGDVAARDRDPFGFLDRVWSAADGRACVGFKITPAQMRDDVYDALLADAGIAKIVLYRRNVVRAFVSERIAQTLGQWEAYDAAALARGRPRVRVAADELVRYADDVRAFYDRTTGRLAATGQGWLALHYESLTALETQRRAFAYLGVTPPAAPFAARSVRQNPGPLAQLIANHDELAAALRGHPLARALERSD